MYTRVKFTRVNILISCTLQLQKLVLFIVLRNLKIINILSLTNNNISVLRKVVERINK